MARFLVGTVIGLAVGILLFSSLLGQRAAPEGGSEP